MQFSVSQTLVLSPLTPDYLRAYRKECAALLDRIPTTDTQWETWVQESIGGFDRGDRSRFDPAFSFVVHLAPSTKNQLRPPVALLIANIDPADSKLPYRGKAVYLSKAATDPRSERLGIMSCLFKTTFLAVRRHFRGEPEDTRVMFTKVAIRNAPMNDIIVTHYHGRTPAVVSDELRDWAAKGGPHNIYEWTLSALEALIERWRSSTRLPTVDTIAAAMFPL
jgi:hypothetical protein